MWPPGIKCLRLTIQILPTLLLLSVVRLNSLSAHADPGLPGSQEVIKTLNDLRHHIAWNIRYPREASENGHVGSVVLYARMNSEGRAVYVDESIPSGEYIDIDEIIIIGYGDYTGTLIESDNHETLVSECRRVIMNVPGNEIGEIQGRVVRFTFRFDLRSRDVPDPGP